MSRSIKQHSGDAARNSPKVAAREALPHVEADPWGEWPRNNLLDQILENAPDATAEFDISAVDLVHLDELKSRLSLLFQAIATFTPEEVAKVEELAAKIRKSKKVKDEPVGPLQPPDKAVELFANRADKGEDIVHFVRRLYAPYLDGVYFTMATLRKLDRSAVAAIYRWVVTNDWPDDLDLPTVPEANERLIASGRIEQLRLKMHEHGFLTENEHYELQRLVGARSKKNVLE